MSYNVVKVTITDSDSDSFAFEMQSFNLGDPVDQTSRYGQKIQTGIGDPWPLTGEVNYNTALMNFLTALSKNGKFFTVTLRINVEFNSIEKRVYTKCLVQSDVYLNTLERGSEQLINIAFSLNELKSVDIIEA